MENRQLRALARGQLNGNWIKCVLALLVYLAIAMIIVAIPILGIIASIVLSGPFLFGLTSYALRIKRGETPSIESLFDGFKNFLTSFLLYLLISIFTFLWSLLLIIPGIIASLSYSMAFFILHDNPHLSAMEALNESKQMMKGYKGKLFLLYLSFIGWILLAALTFGIGYLWLYPYMGVSFANFYDDLKGNHLHENPTSKKEEPLFRENPSI
jgi:uncharacterized membrane protein